MAEIHDLKIVAEFSNEMLEQIRAVVREELQVVFTQAQITLQRLESKIQHDVSTDDSSPDRLVSGTIFKDGKPTALGRQLIKEVKQSIAREWYLKGQTQ